MKMHFRIPPYIRPRNEWRKLIYEAAFKEMRARNVEYGIGDKLEVDIVLYLNGEAAKFHDVDNRLKDVLDALQGRMGGSKAIRKYQPLIPNDNQVYKATVTKMKPPPQSHGFGHVSIRKYKE